MTVMTGLIDLDHAPDAAEEAPGPPPDVLSFRAWFVQWAPHRPVVLGIVCASLLVAVGTVAAIVALALTYEPPGPPPKAAAITSHTFSVAVPDGAATSKAVLYRTNAGDLLLRDRTADELIEAEPSSLTNVAAVTVTVFGGPDGRAASCELTVDGNIVDSAEGTDGSPAICMWVAAPVKQS